MEYPKKIMRASEMAKHTGQPKTMFTNLLKMPGQNFAWKMSAAYNSPVLIDTEGYERWRTKQVRTAGR